ncbi:hypothetical protein R3P38DRAFT_3219608 [Favolaschia claudopus]|uniref:Uncharacterized protein n=1 Tax=Favolaschia claudopus TaxID=2862362 RepID=A0AAW0A2A1_9AGAR
MVRPNRANRRPTGPPLMEHDRRRDYALPFHCLNRGRKTAHFGRHPFSEEQGSLVCYHPASVIGGEAMAETFFSLRDYRNAHPDPKDRSPACIDARILVRAQLAATFGTAIRRQLIDDRLRLPEILFARAVEQLQADEFVAAWTATEVPQPVWIGWGDGTWVTEGGWGSDWTWSAYSSADVNWREFIPSGESDWGSSSGDWGSDGGWAGAE